MSGYTYTRTVDDFKSETVNNISIKQLKFDITNSQIYTPIWYINRVLNEFTFNFYAELTESELIIFNNIITNYKTTQFDNDVALLEDIKTNGTNGGTFIQDSWITRTINNIKGVVDFVSISNNQFTLVPGHYSIMANVSASNVQMHRCRLYDITHSVVVANGSNSYANINNSASTLFAMFEIGVNTTFELQHRCSQTCDNTGLGCATGFGGEEIYLTIQIIKQ